MKGKYWFAVVGAALAAGCASLNGVRNAEGFTYFDGKLETSAPSDFFVLRFECPGGIITNNPSWMKGLQRWNFVEVRQLKDSVTVVNDGVFRTEKRRVAGVNWAKWLKPGSRDVLSGVRFIPDFATIVMGVRRCGKSTLAAQCRKASREPVLALNFDDLRMMTFSSDDFRVLDRVIDERGVTLLVFDEIHNVKGFKDYVM